MPDQYKNKNLFGWLGFGSNLFNSVANVVATALTNRSNQRIEAARNAMQIAENEKAYQRSKPTNQVANLQAAGMSKAGALNVLSGGGSYTPASISSSSNQAPQLDLASAFDGLIQIGENAKQRKLQEDLIDKQLLAAKEQQQAQILSDEKKHNNQLRVQKEIAELEANTTNRNADNRLNYDKDYFNKVLLPESRKRIKQIEEDTKYTKEQREHFKELRPLLKENAQEEVNKLKEEIKSITSLRNLEVRRFALDKLKVRLEYYYGVRLNELRSTLKYWENKPETLYKGIGWRSDSYKELDTQEDDLFNYLENLGEVLDEIDRLESN